MSLHLYVAELVRVVDGDTVEMNFDYGFTSWQRHVLRLGGVDAQEMKTPEGPGMKAVVGNWFRHREGCLIYVQTVKTRVPDDEKSGAFGRYLAWVYDVLPTWPAPEKYADTIDIRLVLGEDFHCLNFELIEQGAAWRWR